VVISSSIIDIDYFLTESAGKAFQWVAPTAKFIRRLSSPLFSCPADTLVNRVTPS